jgi:hypothetical protein
MIKTLPYKSFSYRVPNSKDYLLLFLLWPFLAFITALTNYSQKEARKVVYIFIIYYGLNFVNSNEAVDAFRYALNLKANAQLPFSDFFKIVGGLYSDTTVDIVEPLISFIVSRFTSHYGVYFAVWAAIFGFFYLKSINLLYDRFHENHGWNTTIIMIFFIMILPVTTISGVRMWTAAWIFFYGAYHVVLYRDPRYMAFTLASSLLHWSLFSANAVLLIFFFLGNRNIIYLPLTITSFVVPKLLSPIFQLISLKLGGPIQRRFEGYSNEDLIISQQESLEQASWFLRIVDSLIFYYIILALIVIQLTSGSLMKGKSERSLFSFLLLFLSFVNFGMLIPSFGGRFQALFLLFATLYIFLYYVKLEGNKIDMLILIGLFPMLLYSVMNFRLGSESISAWIFTPCFGLPFLVLDLSIADFLFR